VKSHQQHHPPLSPSLPPSLPQVIANIEGILAENKDLLTECRVRMVNVLFVQGAKNPRYFTFTAAEVRRKGGREGGGREELITHCIQMVTILFLQLILPPSLPPFLPPSLLRTSRRTPSVVTCALPSPSFWSFLAFLLTTSCSAFLPSAATLKCTSARNARRPGRRCVARATKVCPASPPPLPPSLPPSFYGRLLCSL